MIVIRARPPIQCPPPSDLELEKSAGRTHNVLLPLVATRVPHKIGKKRKVVGANVWPYPAPPGPQRRPVKTWSILIPNRQPRTSARIV